jgi:hypothetical protein
MQRGVWRSYGVTLYPSLGKVLHRLFDGHPTSAANDRIWALSGRPYTAANNALGLQRAKKLITLYSNHGSRVVNQLNSIYCFRILTVMMTMRRLMSIWQTPAAAAHSRLYRIVQSAAEFDYRQ